MFDISEINEIAKDKISKANAALKDWHTIDSKYGLNEYDRVLLFCDASDEVNQYGMLYIDVYAERFNIENIVVLTNNDYVKENVEKYSKSIIGVEDFTRDQIDRMVTLYSLYPFDHRFEVVSLDEPYCRKAGKMVGVKGTSVEQLVAIGVYGIIPFKPLEKRMEADYTIN